MSANLLSMGAVDFGIIVDGARGHHREHRAALASPRARAQPSAAATSRERIYAAVAEVVRPTVFSLLIIIAAYLPIFLLERVEGRIFAPMANTVVAALIGALLFSLTLVPVLATFCLPQPDPAPRLAGAAPGAARPTSRRCAGPCARPRWSCSAACWRWLAAGARAVAPRLRVPARAQRGRAVPHLHAALEHQLDRGAQAGAAHHRDPRAATRRSTTVLSQLGRPEDGTDADADQQPGVLRPAEAARRSGRRSVGTLADVIARLQRRARRRSRASRSTSRSPSATTSTRTSPASSARSRSRSTATT